MAGLRRSVSSEEIYDALIDDESLAILPQRLASAHGARSALIHWVYTDATADILAHSRYFSDEQLGTYAAQFAALDPWIEASSQRQTANVAMNLEELVPVLTFTRTTFYNDYVRAMGDDTCRCMGLRIQNEFGSGFVALQRGRSQPGFEADAVAGLQISAAHLRRMLSLRGRLASAERRHAGTAAMLDALGQAAILVTSTGRVVHCNDAGAELLNSPGAMVLARDVLCALNPSADRRFKNAVALAAAPADAQATAVNIPRRSGGFLALSLAPILVEGRRYVLILANDPGRQDTSLSLRLRELYHLSSTEAQLAVMLGNGKSLAAIAEERGVALSTVQTQIKTILAKLDVGRQADIVGIVQSLPRLR